MGRSGPEGGPPSLNNFTFREGGPLNERKE